MSGSGSKEGSGTGARRDAVGSISPAGSAAGWRPSAGRASLSKRAELLAEIRSFFHRRGVLEVETPLLARHGVTDPHLHSLGVEVRYPGIEGSKRLFLQTSPEFAMKRLLAAGSGPIYQISKAFRDDEAGRFHNPEFTMLEWYRPGFDQHRLMDEMDELLAATLDAGPAERLTYREAFRIQARVDPLTASPRELESAARDAGIEVSGSGPNADSADAGAAGGEMTGDDLLHLLSSHLVEPHLGRTVDGRGRPRPTFLFDYPASQAALARVRAGSRDEPAVAERFEVYLGGVELANGFHELADAEEQAERFLGDLEERRRRGLPEPEPDPRLLAALRHGLPDCAGVALGIDRLLMLATGAEHIREVLAFPIDRA